MARTCDRQWRPQQPARSLHLRIAGRRHGGHVALIQSASGTATVGSFVSFITALLMLLSPLRHLADVNAPLQRGLAAAESVFQLLDESNERTGHDRCRAPQAGCSLRPCRSATLAQEAQRAGQRVALKSNPGRQSRWLASPAAANRRWPPSTAFLQPDLRQHFSGWQQPQGSDLAQPPPQYCLCQPGRASVQRHHRCQYRLRRDGRRIT